MKEKKKKKAIYRIQGSILTVFRYSEHQTCQVYPFAR